MNLQIIDTSSVSVTGLTERMRQASLGQIFIAPRVFYRWKVEKPFHLLCKKIQVFSGKRMCGYLSSYTI